MQLSGGTEHAYRLVFNFDDSSLAASMLVRMLLKLVPVTRGSGSDCERRDGGLQAFDLLNDNTLGRDLDGYT